MKESSRDSLREDSGWVPRVSVPMVTFRHEGYVREAIESVLAQDMPDWEIVVADDASDDGTIEVVRSLLPACEWQGRQRLRVLPFEEKHGRRRNYNRVMEACRGQYTAQLDGDDFLVSDRSLSLRADFLDSHPDFSVVFSAWHETDEAGQPEGPVRRMQDGRKRFTYLDFGIYCLCTSSAVMSRRGLYGAFPDWYEGAPVGDWPLHVLNGLHGDIGFLDVVLAIHRNQPGGVWSKEDELGQLNMTLGVQSLFVEKLPEPAQAEMRKRIVPYNFALALAAENAGDLVKASRLFDWCAIHAKGQLKGERLWRRKLGNRLRRLLANG